MNITFEDLIDKSLTELRLISMLNGRPLPDLEKVGDLYFISMPADGLSIRTIDTQNIDSFYLYSGKTDEYKRFLGTLPFGVTFDMPKSAVRAQLGEPNDQSDGVVLPILGKKNPWDMYKLGRSNIYIEYSETYSNIELIVVRNT